MAFAELSASAARNRMVSLQAEKKDDLQMKNRLPIISLIIPLITAGEITKFDTDLKNYLGEDN